MSEKWGLSHMNPEKSVHSYTFCWKKGASYIPGSPPRDRESHSKPKTLHHFNVESTKMMIRCSSFTLVRHTCSSCVYGSFWGIDAKYSKQKIQAWVHANCLLLEFAWNVILIWHFMHVWGDNLHEVSNPVFSGKKIKKNVLEIYERKKLNSLPLCVLIVCPKIVTWPLGLF